MRAKFRDTIIGLTLVFRLTLVRFVLAMVALLFVCSCYNSDTTNESQQGYIVSYLQSSHSPTLIPESEVEDTIDEEPAFYSTFGTFAYRYIATYYDEGRDAKAEITSTSRVAITFEIYPTSNGSVSSSTLPSYTNNSYFESSYIAAGLTPTYWDFTPLEFTIGDGTFLESVDECLVGCRQDDRVEIYLTCNMAYGNNVIGLIDEESALLVICVIDNVEN
ncbi:MAG: FKBP-type peptidyl-prolyl cis-trans isomerase [Rikenellaceae bacterium]